MLARVDSLMEMSRINQALCKQLAFLLSRTAFDRTKENLFWHAIYVPGTTTRNIDFVK